MHAFPGQTSHLVSWPKQGVVDFQDLEHEDHAATSGNNCMMEITLSATSTHEVAWPPTVATLQLSHLHVLFRATCLLGEEIQNNVCCYKSLVLQPHVGAGDLFEARLLPVWCPWASGGAAAGAAFVGAALCGPSFPAPRSTESHVLGAGVIVDCGGVVFGVWTPCTLILLSAYRYHPVSYTHLTLPTTPYV